MRRAKRLQRGITLVELLVAAVILGFCSVPIIGSIAMVRQNVVEAKVQAQVRTILQSDLADMMSQGKSTRLATGTTSRNVSLPGGTTVSVARTIAKIGGFKELFSVKSTATWTPAHASGRTDTASLETYAITIP